MAKTVEPKIIPRAEHTLSRSQVSPHALKVLYRLKEAGFQAYLVGGSVRDLLLNNHPKDFDVATDAHPEEVHTLFRNCILIGRRFRLAHIRFRDEIVEVATFRQDPNTHTEQGLLLHDNVYGTLEEDAWRRDFTVNALYYRIDDFAVVDYCGGMQDLAQKTIRMIGDPVERYQEDPVRLLRAVRFAGKLGFTIEPKTAKPLKELAYLLTQVSPSRLFEESLKLLLNTHVLNIFHLLTQYDLLKQLFPSTAVLLKHPNHHPVNQFLENAMRNSAERLTQGKTITPVFILAVLLWYPLLQHLHATNSDHLPPTLVIDDAIRQTLKAQLRVMTIPKRFTNSMAEVWRLQFRMQKAKRRAAISKILAHPRFRAAYDFLLLRAQSGEKVQELAQRWTQLHDADKAQINAMNDSSDAK